MEIMINILKALADETRLRILLLLDQRDLCVFELMNVLKMEQSRVSHSLNTLKSARLVQSTRKGRWFLYSLNPEMKNSDLVTAVINNLQLSREDQKTLEEYACNHIFHAGE